MRFPSPSRRLLCTLPQKLNNVPVYLRKGVLKEAQCWLTDYLNSTRAIPLSHADSIVSHAPLSLFSFVSQVPFPSSTARADLKRIFRRFLTYRPVNEYDFFFESIGLPPSSSSTAASTYPSYFLSDDALLLAAVTALVRYGFPWTKLGLLYREEPRIFSSDSDRLVSRLRALEVRGFNRAFIIGICLAFPSALSADADPGGEIDHLFQYLNKVFLNFDLSDSVPEHNVDIFLQVCRNIRVFYDLDSRKGTMGGELMCKNLQKIFIELDDALIAQKLKFFINLGMDASEAGHFILKHADIFNIDLENLSILMPEYLKSVGLEEHKVALLSRKFPYVMGKNKLGNLPAMMKAMNLHKWFLDKILNGNLHYISSEFVLAGSHDTVLDSGFHQGLERLKCAFMEQFLDKKVEFLLSIGFGENKLTLRSISAIKGPNDQLQKRFDSLLELGIEYSVLCRMVNAKPLILNQCKDTFHEKVNFLCNDMGCSLEYLENFPAFLCFSLENRIKPRFKMLESLKELGLLKKHFAPSTILSNSDKVFMTFLYRVHPAAPKQWLECYSSKRDKDGNQRTIFMSHHGHKNQA